MRRREQLPALARAVADDQDGVITRPQALTSGLSDRVIHRLVTDGAWQRLDNGIFVVGSAPVTWEQWARGGLLWAGEPSALGGQAAGFMYGLAPRPSVIDLWVPFEASHRPARTHWRLRYDGEGRLAGAWGRLPATSVEDTALDLADAADMDGALAVLTRVLAEGRTHEGRIRAALAERSRVRHRALLTDVVSSRKGFESGLEYHLETDVLRPHGLPLGRTQVVTGAGRVDRLIEEFRLVLEADGRVGHEGEGRFRDMRRDNANALRGLRTLRLGWFDVRLNPCDTARGIAEVLRQEGWQGRLTACRRCPTSP